jgi:hypothetical protein
MVLLTQALGTSRCTENVFESRFSFVDAVERSMGADVDDRRAPRADPWSRPAARRRGDGRSTSVPARPRTLGRPGRRPARPWSRDVHHVDRGYADWVHAPAARSARTSSACRATMRRPARLGRRAPRREFATPTTVPSPSLLIVVLFVAVVVLSLAGPAPATGASASLGRAARHAGGHPARARCRCRPREDAIEVPTDPVDHRPSTVGPSASSPGPGPCWSSPTVAGSSTPSRSPSPGDGQRLVNDLTIDDYVAGVAEMPGRWHEEALKAQAVAARTYAWHLIELGTFDARGFDICDTVDCQVVPPVSSQQESRVQGDRWRAAVDATAGAGAGRRRRATPSWPATSPPRADGRCPNEVVFPSLRAAARTCSRHRRPAATRSARSTAGRSCSPVRSSTR